MACFDFHTAHANMANHVRDKMPTTHAGLNCGNIAIGAYKGTFTKFVTEFNNNNVLSSIPHEHLKFFLENIEVITPVLRNIHKGANTWRGGSTGVVGVDANKFGKFNLVPFARHIAYMLFAQYDCLVDDLLKLVDQRALIECADYLVENTPPCPANDAWSELSSAHKTPLIAAKFVVYKAYEQIWLRFVEMV